MSYRQFQRDPAPIDTPGHVLDHRQGVQQTDRVSAICSIEYGSSGYRFGRRPGCRTSRPVVLGERTSQAGELGQVRAKAADQHQRCARHRTARSTRRCR